MRISYATKRKVMQLREKLLDKIQLDGKVPTRLH